MEKTLCLFCNNEIKQTKFIDRNRYTEKIYCNEKCRHAMERVKYKEYYKKWWIEHTWIFNNKEKRICSVCDTKFLPKYKCQFYCSEKCRKKSWKIKHREEVLKKEREYNAIRKLDPIKKQIDKESNKKSRQNNEKRHEWRRNYRARKVSNGGKHTLEQWKELKIKYNFTCVGCGKQEPEIKLTEDHIVPLSRFIEWAKKNNPNYKANDIKNIQPLCQSCNSKKNNNLDYKFDN